MSLYVKYAHYCDFCGSLIHKESFILYQDPGHENYGIPHPRPNNFRTGSHNWDLCTTCVDPLRKSLDSRIKELQEKNELNTIIHPQQVEKGE